MNASSPFLILGAGVAGLVAAVQMQDAGRPVTVLEARDRVGGRCVSLDAGGICVDLGAAWHWSEHDRVRTWADRLGLRRIRQHEPGVAVFEAARNRPVQRFEWPETPPPSWRLAGGTQALAQALADRLPPEACRLRHRATALRATDTGVVVTCETPDGMTDVSGRAAVVAIPPRLAGHRLSFAPSLPETTMHVLRETPTWMSHSAKAAVVYPRPFWREAGLAGRVRSLAGPINDWHDATPDDATPDGLADERPGALFGFGAPEALQGMNAEARQDALVRQLVHCFGEAASDPMALAWHDWSADRHTTPEAGSACRGMEPEPVPRLTQPHWDGRLLFAAAETALDHPGFLDGALEAGTRAANAL